MIFADRDPVTGFYRNIREHGCSELPAACDCAGPHWDPLPDHERVELTAEQLATWHARTAEEQEKVARDDPSWTPDGAWYDAKISESVDRLGVLQARRDALTSPEHDALISGIDAEKATETAELNRLIAAKGA